MTESEQTMCQDKTDTRGIRDGLLRKEIEAEESAFQAYSAYLSLEDAREAAEVVYAWALNFYSDKN